MSLRRTFDPAFLNEVVNHPEVRPWLGGEGALDLSATVTNPANFALVNKFGGWIVVCLDAGLYEVHSQFLPEGRGQLVDDMMAAIHFMFTATDCVELMTRCPDNNRAAQSLAKTAGFQEIFRREECWAVASDKPCGCSFQSLRLEAWRNNDPSLIAMGREFHHRLERAKLEAGSSLVVHPDDEAHERAVGAAIAMARAGNPQKAAWTYNRWARVAGYAPIQLISEHPPVFDVVDAIMTLAGDKIEVLLCR